MFSLPRARRVLERVEQLTKMTSHDWYRMVADCVQELGEKLAEKADGGTS